MRGRKSENEKKVELFADWLIAPEEERLIKTQKEFAESIGVEEHTVMRWKTQLAKTDTEDEIALFRGHVYRLAMKSNATAKHMELYAKLKGLLEKPETRDTTPLTADQLARFHLEGEGEARRYLLEHGYGGCYDRAEIEGILQYAKEEGIIEDFKELPSTTRQARIFETDIEQITRESVNDRVIFPRK